jgi:hypothetical protein
MIVKRIGVLSLAKVMAVIYVGIGLIAGVCLALFSTVAGGMFAQQGAGGLGMGMGMGMGAIITLPILYGLFGFIGGLISGWLYNLVAGWIGGIELDLQ